VEQAEKECWEGSGIKDGVLHQLVIGLAALGSDKEFRSDEGLWEGELSGAQKMLFCQYQAF
jgi:hypothetical protein